MASIFSSSQRIKESALNFANVKSGEASLFVGGSHYSDWLSLSIEKDMDELVHKFTFNLVDKWRPLKKEWPINLGDEVKITFGVGTILTGYVDVIDSKFNNSGRSFSISGRSKTCDLVDCSYLLENQIKITTFSSIAKKICDQFGIDVLFQTVPFDEPFDFVAEQGETCFEALTRYAYPRGYLLQTNEQGNLIVFNRDIFSILERSKTDLIQGKNVLDVSGRFNFSDRFSDYTIKSQGTEKKSVSSSIANATEGKAKDNSVKRFRPKLIISDNTLLPIAALKQAQWESDVRARNSMDIELIVNGWTKADGSLWDIGQLVAVVCPSIGISRDMLISRVVYSKSNDQGTTCNISVVPSDSYKNEPIKKEELPAGWEDQINSLTLGGALA